MDGIKQIKNKVIFNFISYVVLLLLAAAESYINLAISPKYPMAYSQYNQSIFYLFGKLMKDGKVPYIDMVDHKGIYIYLIHYLAEVVCENSHIGLYIIGVFFIFINSLFIYKLLLLLMIDTKLSDVYKNISACVFSFLAIVLQTIYTISYGTLQCETFLLSAILISIYIFIYDIYVNKGEHTVMNTMIYGILFSFQLLIKANYNIMYLYIAIYILVDLCAKKEYKQIWKHLAYSLIGIVIGLLPGIIYCVYTNCFKEMIYNAFIVNMIYSKAPYFGVETKAESYKIAIGSFKYIYLFLIIGMGLSVFIRQKMNDNVYVKKSMMSMMYIMLMLILAVAIPARDYEYYLIVLIPFAAIIISTIFEAIINIFIKKNVLVAKIVSCGLSVMALAIALSLNSKYGAKLMVKTGKDHLKFAQTVKNAYENNNFSADNKYDVFVLGNEIYLYDYLGKLPNFKYFCLPSIEYKYYTVPFDETSEYISSGKSKYVVIGTGGSFGEMVKNTDVMSELKSGYRTVSSWQNRSLLRSK